MAGARIAGDFPLMTRGWALLDMARDGLDERLLKLRHGLAPSPWTSFGPDAGRALADLIREGVLSRLPQPAFA